MYHIKIVGNYSSNLIEAKTCIKSTWKILKQSCKLIYMVNYSSKILKIYNTIHKNNWRFGGVTYRREVDPNISKNGGLNKDIEKSVQEQQEHEFGQRQSDFLGERKKGLGAHLVESLVGPTWPTG